MIIILKSKNTTIQYSYQCYMLYLFYQLNGKILQQIWDDQLDTFLLLFFNCSEQSLKKSCSKTQLILKTKGIVSHCDRKALYIFSGEQQTCLDNQTAVLPCRFNSFLISLPRCNSSTDTDLSLFFMI